MNIPPWHRDIPSRSKMFEGQGWLKKPCRYTSKAETEFTMCRQWCSSPAHPVQCWLAHFLQLPLARVHHQVHLDLAVTSLYQVPPLSWVPGHRQASSWECCSKVLLWMPEENDLWSASFLTWFSNLNTSSSLMHKDAPRSQGSCLPTLTCPIREHQQLICSSYYNPQPAQEETQSRVHGSFWDSPKPGAPAETQQFNIRGRSAGSLELWIFYTEEELGKPKSMYTVPCKNNIKIWSFMLMLRGIKLSSLKTTMCTWRVKTSWWFSLSHHLFWKQHSESGIYLV